MLLLANFLSPVLMAIVAALLVTYAKVFSLRKTGLAFLVGRSLLYGAIGAGASLIFTVAWMIWYEKSTGYSAGNGPLGWMFFYGPTSIALGQLVALIHWWFKKAA